ncbi:MAG: pilus assembly protein [Myxococcales bacterium]|nr:pilus assembly protein [Myxococcales bacterium]
MHTTRWLILGRDFSLVIVLSSIIGVLSSGSPLIQPLVTSSLVTLCVVSLCFVVAQWYRGSLVGSATGEPMRFHRNIRGASATEFIIIFPVVLLLILGVMQMAQLYIAKMTVNYAAWTAVRDAVITIPEEMDDEPVGQICNISSRSKIREIKVAAVIPLIGISPAVQDLFATRRRSVRRTLGGFEVNADPDNLDMTLDRILVRGATKLPYALLATNVALADPTTGEIRSETCHTYGPSEDVSVVVSYLYFLQMPIIARIIGSTVDTILLPQGRQFLESIDFSFGSDISIEIAPIIQPSIEPIFAQVESILESLGRYTMIRGQATLPNEGE